jgi:hypothetical protein
MMPFELLEVVVLTRGLPQHGLQTRDLGTVVEIYEPAGLEVEFVTACGQAQAVVTLAISDVRKVQPTDLMAVRPLQTA